MHITRWVEEQVDTWMKFQVLWKKFNTTVEKNCEQRLAKTEKQ